jgi:citrate synthase
MTQSFKTGLEDVVAGVSSICFIDGREGRLVYRGYDINDLARYSNFEETTFLLWHGRLPTRAELEALKTDLARARELPPEVWRILHDLPKDTGPMDVLRTAVSALGCVDPDSRDNSADANLRKSLRLTAQFATIVAGWDRVRKGLDPVHQDSGLSHAANFLYMLKGERPDETTARAMDVALILHADHELNASTFTARVIISTLSDVHSAVTGAVGALKGPLHGGANVNVMKMLLEIGDPDHAVEWVHRALAEKRRIPGFGHRVYKTYDPRALILRDLSRQMGEKAGDLRWFEISRVVEEIVIRERGIYPNVDFFSGSMYYSMGIPIDLYTPIFAVSRIAGWTAHILEQLADNRLIRPRAEYVGPERLDYVPLDSRS